MKYSLIDVAITVRHQQRTAIAAQLPIWPTSNIIALRRQLQQESRCHPSIFFQTMYPKRPPIPKCHGSINSMSPTFTETPLQTEFDAKPPLSRSMKKLRQAYFWIVNSAIISPHYDIEYNPDSTAGYVVGDSKRRLTLPSGQSYSTMCCCRC